MKLPNADRAVVEARKVRDYLLAFDHPIGRAKARFFRALGFEHRAWVRLQEALLRHASDGEAEEQISSPYGRKFLVRGSLTGPSGVAAPLVSVWIVMRDDDRPRLVTAYPGGNE
jgi:hypothetical protein